ncbi:MULTISPECIES: hypothetical protein [unclassified Bosea (in: a-proteobacteria)]|uniref:hypothetical protein n=1 Tax=unclassified Bosea (in: a-proteobacteria) TaxID=2653178 RepID=UPI00095719DF|nr:MULTISPECIES: hypothetical protein [unclassified Bosea (in: a-proteobacteria)]TAJ27032.1 MAG: hypothetical protein EPO59_23015 [Bosea sp. (in: a-proteobacteria)]SIP89841.1 hypothetical protein SAMN05880592_10182 [Bosea sp. TND4EK4]
MPRYTDALDLLKEQERALHRAIASRLAEEAGQPAGAELTQALVSAADEAIAQWAAGGEEEHDLAAFRPLGPLEHLLIEHRRTLELIDDLMDRRLG